MAVCIANLIIATTRILLLELKILKKYGNVKCTSLSSSSTLSLSTKKSPI